jgi:hypothetical protein
MDLGRADPRFCTRGEVLDGFRGSLKAAGRMVYGDLRLSEENASGNDAGQKGEDYGRVRTRGGAHLRGQRSEEGANESVQINICEEEQNIIGRLSHVLEAE